MPQAGNTHNTLSAKPQRVILFLRDRRTGAEVTQIVIPGTELSELSAGAAITAEEAAGWFAAAAPRWAAPTAASLSVFVNLLNVLRLSELARCDPNHPNLQRLARVQGAIRTLLADLPAMIQHERRGGERGFSPYPETFAQALALLLTAAEQMPVRWREGPRGKRDARWHETARAIAQSARAAWRAAGRARVGANPTSPLMPLVAQALARIGEGDHSCEAIARALRRHKGCAGTWDAPPIQTAPD